MRILAIETSCDETGIALVEGQKTSSGFVFETKKSALLSQAALHAPYGGVYPNLAKREHEKNIPVLWEQFKNESFEAVAVTSGPGLEPALWQGVEFAKALGKERGVPVFGVNHMEGHLISSLAQPAGEHSHILENVRMSVLGLLISGGHTQFVLMRDWFQYEILGDTLDDAVGEAFDKVARMLALPYPGGPQISKLADEHRTSGKEPAWKLPRPMITSGTCDVSFSGLKTAALYTLRGKDLSDDEKAAFAAEFEDAVADVFVAKARKALEDSGAKVFVIGGGVAANRYIRERLQQLVLDELPEVEFRLPHLSITGDNAIMIAQAALCHLLSKHWVLPPEDIRAVGNLSIAS